MKPKHTVQIFIAPKKQYQDKRMDDRARTTDISLDVFISKVKSASRKRCEDIKAARELAAIEGMFV